MPLIMHLFRPKLKLNIVGFFVLHIFLSDSSCANITLAFKSVRKNAIINNED